MRLASSSSHHPHARASALGSRFSFLVRIVVLALLVRATPAGASDDCFWLTAFEVAYERGDAAAYGALLAPEFRFHFGDAENRSRRPQGWNKEEEIASYVNLHRGVVREDGTRLPRAAEIDVQMAGVREGPDPEHPGSAEHRLLFVQAATLFIRFEGGRRLVDTAPHAFHLVRGRAIGLGGADAEMWFAQKWIERPTDAPALLAALDAAAAVVAGGVADAGGGAADTSGTTGGLVVAGVQAALPARGLLWPNPVRAGRGVSLAFDLADAAADVALEILDVRGRRIARIGPVRAAPGRRVFAWDGRDDAGRAVPAGVYFVRARLGVREAQHRVVVIP